MADELLDDELLEKIKFSIGEQGKVKKIVKGVYDSLLFRKASILIPLDSEKRQPKRMDFLKQDIDDYRLLMIYCYNNFTEMQGTPVQGTSKSKDELRFFTTPIEGVLESDEFYEKLLTKQNESMMPVEDRIEKLQKKTKKSYRATELAYADMMAKIEKTCGKVLNLVGTRDPGKLTAIMLLIFNTVHDTEIKLMDSAVDKGKSEGDETEDKGDPCDANKYLGIDFSFLGFFDKLPEECVSKNESTKISIVGPVNVQSTNGFKEPNVQSTGGSKEPIEQSTIQIGGNISKLKQRQKKFVVQYIMPKPVVICKKKSLKRCKRAYVSCKTVMGASRKYCRRSTKKSIAKYYTKK